MSKVEVGGTARASDEIWADDRLGRRGEAASFARFLDRRYQELKAEDWNQSYSIAIEGPWGLGKTTFLMGLAEELSRNHAIAFVNAWIDDTVDDPLTSLSAAIERAVLGAVKSKAAASAVQNILKNKATIARVAAKGLIKKALEKVADKDSADELMKFAAGAAGNALDEDALSDVFTDQQRSDYFDRLDAIDALKRSIGRALVEIDKDPHKHLPLYVVIDELDRCRPTYAIRMLETVKHIIDVPGLIFLYGVERKQLAAAIRGMYGADFDGSRYLHRFINVGYKLRTPSLEEFCSQLIQTRSIPVDRLSVPPAYQSAPHDKQVARHISDWLGLFGLTARDALTIFDMLKTFITVWESPVPIELVVLLPELIKKFMGSDIAFGDITLFDGRIDRPMAVFQSETVDYTEIYRQLTLKAQRSYRELMEGEDVDPASMYGWIMNRIGEDSKKFKHGVISSDTIDVAKYPKFLEIVERMTSIQPADAISSSFSSSPAVRA